MPFDVKNAKCSGCKQPADDKGRCWKCGKRPCSGCGMDTGSIFIELCIRCGGLDGIDVPPPVPVQSEPQPPAVKPPAKRRGRK